MTGSLFKRCGCRDEASGKQLGTECPRLKRSDHGTWSFRVDVGLPGARSVLKKGGYRDKASAQAALDEVRRRHRAGVAVTVVPTVGEWLEWWWTEKSAGGPASSGGRQLRASTARSYRGHIDKHLKPYIGDIRLDQLSPGHISAMYRAIATPAEPKAKPLSSATVQRVHATLRSALEEAVKHRKIERNVAKLVHLESVARPKVKVWTVDQLATFLDAVGSNELGTIFEVLAFTGLRRGEAVGLRWKDVFLDQAVPEIVVTQAVVQLGHKTVVGRPKTASGEHRRVELGPRAVEALRRRASAQAADRSVWGVAYAETGLVFGKADGSQLDPGRVTKRFAKLVESLGLPAARLHDLRHGYASLALQAGTSLPVVSKMMGHSTLAITVDTYMHLAPGAAGVAAAAAEALVPRRQGGAGLTQGSPSAA